MRRIIQPYVQNSKSAKALASALTLKRVRLNGTQFQPRQGDVVLNWGSSKQLFADEFYFNKPSQVSVSTNKLSCLNLLARHDVPVPAYTNDRRYVGDLMEAGPVYCRTLLRANSGRGIVVATQGSEVVDAPFYTAFFDKDYEVRVHIFKGNAFDFQQKRKRSGSDNDNRFVFNHGNDRVFCRNNFNIPSHLREKAEDVGVKAVTALGLDFGAVDIGVKDSGEVVVFEVNTAPGLTGTTLTNYANKLGEV